MPRDNSEDSGVKPGRYLPIYEEVLASLRGRPITLLELGVWKGDSLVMWRDGFPKGTIVGIDLDPPSIDLGQRVHCERGDAADPELLRQVADRHAPGGFDVVVDDASHGGRQTAAALYVLFRDHLRPGGIYVIEDWATGYHPLWPDGDAPARVLEAGELERTEREGSGELMASHQFGMVGLVKRLVDHVAAPTIRVIDTAIVGEALPIESVTFYDGLVVVRKAPAAAESRGR
jgi:SAM-dependent methyltransferase